MTSSDSDFDDDDDDFLLNIDTKTQASANLSSTVPSSVPSSVPPPTDLQTKLYRADGEISILREKYQQLQNQRLQETSKLKEQQHTSQRRNEDQIKALQYTVQKLEDEKKFLTNELRGGSSAKRRKRNGYDDMEIDDLTTTTPNHNNTAAAIATAASKSLRSFTPPTPKSIEGSIVKKSSGKIIRIQNDSSLFIDHLWNCCINGADRSSLSILSKIYLENDIVVNELKIKRKEPISSCLIEYLMMKKNLRLDDLVSEFTLMLVELIEQILDTKLILSIPFLFLLIHSTINFRPLAVTKSTIKSLLQGISRISIKYWYILEEAQNQEEEGNFQDDSPDQVIILQKLTLIFSIDIIEKLTAISSLHGELFIQEIWHDDIIPMELLQRCLPENSERFKNTSQINLVYNIVEILMSSITELSMAYSSGPKRQQLSIFNSLLKVLLIDIPLKDDFMFYGLNRIIGNNIDIRKVESVVPIDETPIGLTMISIPSPIPYELLQERVQENQNCTKNGSQINKSKSRLLFDLSLKHQNHLLNLRIRVTTLLEHYILTTEQIDSLQLKDFIKSMVRTIGFEQSNILKNPRSKNVHLRTQIIANLVRILNYISSEAKGGITTLVYPETLYEIFVTLLRIAFGSNSLSSDARQVIESIRNNVKYFETPIFNKWCEIRSKQLNHIDNTEGGDGKFISEIESQYANGLEFPYEEETIELAREILDLCVTHEEADNLYFNMNCEDAKNNDGEGDEEDEENFDEMDLVQ